MIVVPFQQTEAGARAESSSLWSIEADDLTVGVQVWRHRLLPWLFTGRVPRFGRTVPPEAIPVILETLCEMARSRPLLRLTVEAWSEDEAQRRRIAEAASLLGYRRSPSSRSYGRTIWIDLSANEDEILRGFSGTCRHHIRAPERKGYTVRPITDLGSVETVRTIFLESFRRTGGQAPDVAWDEVIRMNGEPGARLHLCGLFQNGRPSNPLSFALAYRHGDVAEYAHAGSIRDPAHNIPLLYAPTWELMRWAREEGARFWDFGGITGSGPPGKTSRMAGIHQFKTSFSRSIISVGEEWSLEPRPRCARLARLAHSGRR